MKPFQAIFFDLYDTLIRLDYTRLPQVVYRGRLRPTTLQPVHRELVEEWGLKLSLRDLLEASSEVSLHMRQLKSGGREYPSSRRFTHLAQRLGIEDRRAVERMVELHMEGMFSMMTPDSDLERVLNGLDGQPLYLASNFDHASTARRALKRFDLEERLRGIYISDEVGWCKPSLEFFRRIIEASGCDPAACLFVGDDPQADCAASLAGFRTAWIRRRRGHPDPPPDWTLQRLRQVLDIALPFGPED